MSEPKREEDRTPKLYIDEIRARLTSDVIAKLKKELPQNGTIDAEFILLKLSLCLALQRAGGKDYHLRTQKIRSLSLDKLSSATSALKAAAKALNLLRRDQVDGISAAVVAMEQYYFELIDENEASSEQQRCILSGEEGILELISKTRADLERLICLCELAISGLQSIPKRPDTKLDFEGKLMFRCAVMSWVACAKQLPPIGKQGPFIRFFEVLRQVLPDDCRPRALSEETLKRWISDLRARG